MNSLTASDEQPQRAYRSHSTVQVPLAIASETSTTPFLQYRTSDFVYDLRKCPVERLYGEKSFKNQVLRPWDAAKSRKVFNYDLNCMYKLLEGQYNLSIQLNVERGTLRRKPMRFQSIRQPFNHLRWNFTKLKPDEILYLLRCLDMPYTDDVLDTHVLCVNASPLERGHSLVVPSVGKCLPQILTETSVRIATDLMLLVEDENFHVLFNSLLGQASVNHLHLHTIFWPYESDLIYRRFDKVFDDVYVIKRPGWYIPALAFQLSGPTNFQTFIARLTQCANFLTNENIAHNLFMTRAPPIRTKGEVRSEEGVREQPLHVTAYLFPRQCHRGAKPPTNFSPASVELAGCLTSYTYRFFESATEQTAIRIVEEEAILPEADFDKIVEDLADRYAGRTPWTQRMQRHSARKSKSALEVPSTGTSHSRSGSDTGLSSNELDELADSFHTVTSSVPPLRHHHSFTNAYGASSALERFRSHSGDSL